MQIDGADAFFKHMPVMVEVLRTSPTQLILHDEKVWKRVVKAARPVITGLFAHSSKAMDIVEKELETSPDIAALTAWVTFNAYNAYELPQVLNRKTRLLKRFVKMLRPLCLDDHTFVRVYALTVLHNLGPIACTLSTQEIQINQFHADEYVRQRAEFCYQGLSHAIDPQLMKLNREQVGLARVMGMDMPAYQEAEHYLSEQHQEEGAEPLLMLPSSAELGHDPETPNVIDPELEKESPWKDAEGRDTSLPPEIYDQPSTPWVDGGGEALLDPDVESGDGDEFGLGLPSSEDLRGSLEDSDDS